MGRPSLLAALPWHRLSDGDRIGVRMPVQPASVVDWSDTDEFVVSVIHLNDACQLAGLHMAQHASKVAHRRLALSERNLTQHLRHHAAGREFALDVGISVRRLRGAERKANRAPLLVKFNDDLPVRQRLVAYDPALADEDIARPSDH